MIKKTAILVLMISLLLSVLSPVSTQAQTELAILESSATAEFPDELRFSLSAESAAYITDIRLHYRVHRDSFAWVISEAHIEFIPAPSVTVSWNWDMRKTGALPPGAIVEYWWSVTDASGSRVSTEPAAVQFDDNRYSWQSLTSGELTLYWYRGDDSFAWEIMDAAQKALTRIAQDTGVHLMKPVSLYIYASAQELQEAMVFSQEWTGGLAYTRYGIIAIGIASNNLQWGKRATIHELAHLVTQQMTFNPYNYLPNWLNEGLSMYAEGELEAQYVDYLEQGVTKNSLISVRSLASPFSAFAEQTYLAYAQSYSLIEFLISSFGHDRMYKLLSTFKQGNSHDDALMKVYGFDMDGLDNLWRDWITKRYYLGA
ncbi:MAG: peptidase MA family metallohydrolase [Dehalococcoidales bacterium]|nr:peptidase MA family metallohydrolase [Dehalococcoidales bacterium]